MKLLNFIEEGRHKLGLLSKGGVIDVEASGLALTMKDAIGGWGKARQLLSALEKERGRVERPYDSLEIGYLPPPSKIICVGVNYKDHARETAMTLPEYPMLFCKMPEAHNRHGGTIPVPPRTCQMDYEAELVVVMGKEAENVSAKEARECIFGYTCGNDVSDRKAQFLSSQMLIGKASPGFGPTGPCVVTSDSIDPDNLNIECRVNGEIRQWANTRQMVFAPPEIVSFASGYIRLNPGDLIFTGTPSGVIMGRDEKERVWLQRGDEVVVTIQGIGSLKNILA